MIGVVTMPPRGPRLVIVIVEPDSSSRRALPRARGVGEARDLGRARPEIERFRMADDRDQQPAVGLGRDADVHGGESRHDALRVVVPRVELREGPDGEHDGAHQERQHGEVPARAAPFGVQPCAQRFELGDVDFLDVGEMRDAQRVLHAQRDLAAQAYHRHLLFAVAFAMALRAHGSPTARSCACGAAKRTTSSCRTRPSGPLPGTCARSTESSRA